jgi:hypothetical protein
MVRINLPDNDDQFFLIENRRFTGWDEPIAWFYGGGLAVYRVDTRWRHNIHESQWRVMMLEADDQGFPSLQNGQRTSPHALFRANPGWVSHAISIDRHSTPAWGVLGSWMRFEVLCESAPEMYMMVQPVLTVLPDGDPLRVRHRTQVQLRAYFADSPVTWQADGDVAVNCAGLLSITQGRGTGTVTATDADGNTHTVQVQSYLNWWQWFIWIFLLGFLWY